MIKSFLTSLFSGPKLVDTALDGLRKLGGLDEMSGQQKADFMINFFNATKHMSPTRRFIAISFVAGFMLFTGTWLISSILFRVGMGLGLSPAFCGQMDLLREDIFEFCLEILKEPITIILAFYFTAQIVNTLKR